MERQWKVPSLTREGQEVFWSRQASGYQNADMTLDNEGELDLVRALSLQFSRSALRATDIVTLGGAVGSRDPKIVVDTLESQGQKAESIYFNDLSEAMTRHAMGFELASYASKGNKVTLLPGAIHEVAGQIPTLGRRVIIGVYKAEAFIKANPHYGYSLTGFEEYLKNASIIGTHLVIELVHMMGDSYGESPVRMFCTNEDAPEYREKIRARIAHYLEIGRFDAIRVIGTHDGKEGFFLSHWFTEQGIRRLAVQCFGPERLSTMSLMSCAKGFVLCIDPVTPPSGIVTMLNNVLGNILPNEQAQTLRAIDLFSR